MGVHDVLRRLAIGLLSGGRRVRSRFGGRSSRCPTTRRPRAGGYASILATTKVLAFALSAMYAGIAGSLSVLVDQNASGDDKLATFQFSIEFLVAVVIGGTRRPVLGPIIGGFAVVYIQNGRRTRSRASPSCRRRYSASR